MSYQVKVVLTTHGANTAGSTFNIYQNFDGYNTAVATGITYANIIDPAIGATVTVNDNTTIVRVIAVGGVCGAAGSQVNITISGVPTPTQTPTVTPTPTTFYPGCGSFLSDSYAPTTFHTYPDYLIDLNAETNGGNVRIAYDAKGRANRFAIYDRNGNQIVTTGWVGDTAGYLGNEYFYPTGAAIGYIDFIYNNTKQYKLKVDTGGAPTTGVTSGASDNWEVTIICQGAPGTSPTPTVTPTATPYTPFYGIIRTTSPTAAPITPRACANGGLSGNTNSQLVWKFESNTNNMVNGACTVTNFQGNDPSYAQLSDFGLISGSTYWLCDEIWGYTQFTYNGGNSLSIGIVFSDCPSAYELPVYRTGSYSGACAFHTLAVASGNAYQYFIANGIMIITIKINNNYLTDAFGSYYNLDYTPVNGTNYYYVDQAGNKGTIDSSGVFSPAGNCSGGGPTYQ
jgi:hypothetical protein